LLFLPKYGFFFLSSSLSCQTNDNFGNFFFKFPKASPYYRGKKLVEFDLDLLEITQISNFCNFFGYFFAKQPFFLPSFLPLSRQSNDKFGNFFSNFQRLHLITVAKSW
jgi:hypothetical protein